MAKSSYASHFSPVSADRPCEMTVTGRPANDMLTLQWYARLYMTPNRSRFLHPLYALPAAVLAAVLHSSPVRAQAAQPPAQPATPPPATVPVPTIEPIGENYRFEVFVAGWSTLPSKMFYSDTETVTPSGSTTSTTVTGTNIDF